MTEKEVDEAHKQLVSFFNEAWNFQCMMEPPVPLTVETVASSSIIQKSNKLVLSGVGSLPSSIAHSLEKGISLDLDHIQKWQTTLQYWATTLHEQLKSFALTVSTIAFLRDNKRPELMRLDGPLPPSHNDFRVKFRHEYAGVRHD